MKCGTLLLSHFDLAMWYYGSLVEINSILYLFMESISFKLIP